MCDKQLVSELADDVTKEKNRLRENLLAIKITQHFEEKNEKLQPSDMTLTCKEEDWCMNTALNSLVIRLPEEVKGEYKREIGKELNRRKNPRDEEMEPFFASEGATELQPPNNDNLTALQENPSCFAKNMEFIEQARRLHLRQLAEANIIGFRKEDGDMFYIKYREEFAE